LPLAAVTINHWCPGIIPNVRWLKIPKKEQKMDFELTKGQTMFRDMAKEFARREIHPSVRERDREERFPFDLIKRMGAQGLSGVLVPPEYGGLGSDWMTLGLVTEQLSYFDFSVGMTLFAQIALAVIPILKAGDDAQKKKYIPALCNGDKIHCFAVAEPNAGSDASAIETTAIWDGAEWVLNGNKTWITNATVSDFVIVLVKTDKEKGAKGTTVFIVEKGTPGFSSAKIDHKLGVRSQDTGQLFFRDCRIPRGNQLGFLGKGLSLVLACIEDARFGLSCSALGVIGACIDATVKYCQERNQFGKPIGAFQLVQGRIADMVVDCEASRWLAYRVGYLKDKGLPCSRETAMAKHHNVEAAARAARAAVDLHGAYGLTDDFPVEKIYRDMIAPLTMDGTAHIHKLLIGRSLLGISAFGQ
jgi:butyryl-CoA dehydrogenase